ncbi:unnamed protein product [Adineta ricciae]|uniref:Uncharacterized protein n=1 Tax=Adineta ricciae TaxID=249248 RepID=A0A814F4T3_ADIRI|nr:unnamed protein product [Adineta ricciae]
MDFRTLKSKSKVAEHKPTDIHLERLSEIPNDDQRNSQYEKLQNEIKHKEQTLDLFIKHVSITLNANIDDMRSLLDKKTPVYKAYTHAICGLWLQLKTIEDMESLPLVLFLRTYQLQRAEVRFQDHSDDSTENAQEFLINLRRSRLTHFHICTGSDGFNTNIDSYVGFLVFSYDNQSKFILNGHHCQRGDIVIKQMHNLHHVSSRGVYDTLFKWYYNRSLDEKFFGIGLLYSNKKWRFDLLSHDRKDILPFEYRIFDMYLLTHWLTHDSLPRNVREMELDAKGLLMNQFEIVKDKLNGGQSTDLSESWNEFIGSDIKDLHMAMKLFIQTTEQEIEAIFKQIEERKPTVSDQLTNELYK